MEHLSYEDFLELASEKIIENFQEEEMKYGDGDLTSEQYYNGNIKWYSNQVKK